MRLCCFPAVTSKLYAVALMILNRDDQHCYFLRLPLRHSLDPLLSDFSSLSDSCCDRPTEKCHQ